MSKRSIVVRKANAEVLNVVGDRITLLGTHEETGAEVSLVENAVGCGPPLHRHPWDEHFYVVKGTVCLRIGDEELEAAPGTYAFAPAGVPHCFLNRGPETAEFLSWTNPEGAHAFFRDMDVTVTSFPPDLDRLLEVGARHQVQTDGPPLQA